MKKMTIYALALGFVLSGCGDSESTDSTADDQTGEPATSTPATTTSFTAPGDDVTVYTVTTTDPSMDFEPEDITIAAGDAVKFEMSSTHNAIEVSEEVYNDRGVTPLSDGFQISFGETGWVTFNEPGVYYYVCQPHVMIEMIGTVTVE